MSDLVYFICSFFVSSVFGLACSDSYAFGNYTNLTMAIWSITNAYYYYSLSGIFKIESDYEKRKFITDLANYYFESPLLNISITGILTYCILANHLSSQTTDIEFLLYFHLSIFLNQIPQTLIYSIFYFLLEFSLLLLFRSSHIFLKTIIDKALKIVCIRMIFLYFFEFLNYDYIMTNIILNLCEPVVLFLMCGFISVRSFQILVFLYEQNRLMLLDKTFSKVKSGYLYYFYYGKAKVLRHNCYLLLAFVIPFITYYIGTYIFKDYNYLIKLFAVQEFAQPFSYLLLMNSDQLSLNSIQINRCSIFFIWFVISPYIPQY